MDERQLKKATATVDWLSASDAAPRYEGATASDVVEVVYVLALAEAVCIPLPRFDGTGCGT